MAILLRLARSIRPAAPQPDAIYREAIDAVERKQRESGHQEELVDESDAHGPNQEDHCRVRDAVAGVRIGRSLV